ncbi:MAG: hypothetical protein CMM50_03550, partial [Rhodospirillaceae bacterium]|nr:hypothetical protein [Rhodospirillaceae bacterium]
MESSVVSIWIRNSDSASYRRIDLLLGKHRITVDADDVQELLAIGVLGQQRRQDRRAGGDQRPAR